MIILKEPSKFGDKNVKNYKSQPNRLYSTKAYRQGASSYESK